MRLRVYRCIWPALLCATIYFASTRTHLAGPDTGLQFQDKVNHFAVFGLLATLVVRVPARRGVSLRAGLTAVALVSLYGGLDEWRQSFTPGRWVEFDDWLADTAGAAVAVAAYGTWRAYRRLLERRIRLRIRRRRRPGLTAAPKPA